MTRMSKAASKQKQAVPYSMQCTCVSVDGWCPGGKDAVYVMMGCRYEARRDWSGGLGAKGCPRARNAKKNKTKRVDVPGATTAATRAVGKAGNGNGKQASKKHLIGHLVGRRDRGQSVGSVKSVGMMKE